MFENQGRNQVVMGWAKSAPLIGIGLAYNMPKSERGWQFS